MQALARLCTAIILLLTFPACTSLQTIAASGTEAGKLRNDAVANTYRHLHVETTDGKLVVIESPRVDVGALAGIEAGTAQPVSIAFDRIAKVDQQQFDLLKTTLLVALVLVVLGTAAQAYGYGKILSMTP